MSVGLARQTKSAVGLPNSKCLQLFGRGACPASIRGGAGGAGMENSSNANGRPCQREPGAFLREITDADEPLRAVARRAASRRCWSQASEEPVRVPWQASLSGVRLRPPFVEEMPAGSSSATKCSLKKVSVEPNGGSKSPQSRLSTHLSDRGAGKTGRLAASDAVRLRLGDVRFNPSIQSRTAATSPKGTPVCIMPNGPGFIPRKITGLGCVPRKRASRLRAPAQA